jgi:hypothetical protein
MRFAVQFEDCGTKRRNTELPDREFDQNGCSQKYFNPLELSRDLLAPFVAVVRCADPPPSEHLAGTFPREALGTMRDEGVFCVDGDNLDRGWGECVDESTPVEWGLYLRRLISLKMLRSHGREHNLNSAREPRERVLTEDDARISRSGGSGGRADRSPCWLRLSGL